MYNELQAFLLKQIDQKHCAPLLSFKCLSEESQGRKSWKQSAGQAASVEREAELTFHIKDPSTEPDLVKESLTGNIDRDNLLFILVNVDQ